MFGGEAKLAAFASLASSRVAVSTAFLLYRFSAVKDDDDYELLCCDDRSKLQMSVFAMSRSAVPEYARIDDHRKDHAPRRIVPLRASEQGDLAYFEYSFLTFP